MSAPTRRAAGEGSVYWNEARQRFEGSISVGSGPNRVRRVVTGKTQKAVADKLKKLRDQAERIDPTAGLIRVGQLAELWWQSKGGQVQASTQSTRRERLVHHIIDDPAISGVRLDKLGTLQVERWLNGKRKPDGGPYSHAYLRLIRSDLNGMVVWAKRRQWLTYNPVEEATITAAGTTDPKRTLTQAQALALAETCRTSTRTFANFTLVLMLTGARPGEVAGLPIDHVDFDAGTVHIWQALKRDGGGRPIGLGPTKARRYRTIEVSGAVLDAIRRERVHQARLRLAAGPHWSTEWDGLIFLTATGSPPWASNLRRTIRSLAADVCADIPADLDPYELRHTCASLLADAGVPVQDIVDQLGSADDRMFWSFYRHRVDPVVRNVGHMRRIFGD